jgi:hypothetical protein
MKMKMIREQAEEDRNRKVATKKKPIFKSSASRVNREVKKDAPSPFGEKTVENIVQQAI